MPETQTMLCDACQKEPATFHSTICGPEGMRKRDLCAACFQSLAPSEELTCYRQFMDRLASARCKYCGEPASGCCGGSSTLFRDELEAWCAECAKDLGDFYRRPENQLSTDHPDDSVALQEGEKLKAAAAEYMRQRVAERKRRG